MDIREILSNLPDELIETYIEQMMVILQLEQKKIEPVIL